MFAFLSQIVFMQPVLLSALLALPILLYLLRITPPAPKTIIFPATRFLQDITTENQTPQKAPWWILLLRLLILSLVIFALARPVINPAKSLPGQGPLRLVIDNGWSAAQTWDLQIKAAEEAITQAGREKRKVYILPTTRTQGENQYVQTGPVVANEALSIVRGLKPNPWPENYNALAGYIRDKKERKSIHTLWLSDGLDDGYGHKLIKILQQQGGISYISPASEKLPVLLRPTTRNIKEADRQSDVMIDVDMAQTGIKSLPVTVRALGENAAVIDVQNKIIDTNNAPETLFFNIMGELEQSITQFNITGRKGAGAIFLLDDQFKKRKIGVASPPQAELTAPLIESSYYITRALDPYANITIDEISNLIEQDFPAIILPDVAAMPTETLNALEDWVKDGGLLLRFSGPKIAESRSEQFLLPVQLRAGGRSLSGSLSWDEPQKIAPFNQDSPFYGLNIPEDVTIKQQVLADPAQDLDGKVWAQLQDGTPFITADTVDKGMIVLIHTTANTDWSDFALSGLYVSILKRIIKFAGNRNIEAKQSYATLDPLLVMDGYGNLVSPPPSVKPITADSVERLIPSAQHPPGLYGQGNTQFALNIGSHLPALQTIKNLPVGVIEQNYERSYEVNLMPYILYAAMMLFFLDWIIMIFIIGQRFSLPWWLHKQKIMTTALIIIALLSLSPATAYANTEQDLKYASGFHLAYIETGDRALDTLSKQGLENLAKTLARRTSVEPLGVAALDPARDTLAFFPVIYWPVSAQQKNFSGAALQNIQTYLDQGGTILFDTRDQNRSTDGISNTENARALREITASLNVPPIVPVPNDHVLSRSFYLLDDYPGAYTGGTLWVEQQSVSGRDNVSSVLIGSNDWASAWATAENQRPYRTYSGNYDARQKEQALRFGVNLVMYSLTGNYKADQVHIPHILDRLGR